MPMWEPSLLQTGPFRPEKWPRWPRRARMWWTKASCPSDSSFPRDYQPKLKQPQCLSKASKDKEIFNLKCIKQLQFCLDDLIQVNYVIIMLYFYYGEITLPIIKLQINFLIFVNPVTVEKGYQAETRPNE